MDMVTVPKRVVDLLAQVQKYGAIARASELQEVYRLIVAHSESNGSATCCAHGIHFDNACGACIPPRGTKC